ncbi:VOC family protein [Croceicoccus mobilis]|uniref:Glyoxalase n=1 Tax=Croceicoccus mobilis TaxID=1703339 RepID=A0A917DZ00_9SPHN|nr:VOC family protein [Croceicoccus mobilis]GGD80429.1 glyoxalase [Croceicoccus mobilis]
MSRIFGPTRQLGIVVHDFMGTLRHWTEVQGIGPFFYFTDTPVEGFRLRGVKSEPPVLSIAFGYSGDLQIEIIHQHNAAPSMYREFLVSGREGLNHVSAFHDTAGYDAVYAQTIARHGAAWQEGAIGGVRFAYFETESTPGATICEISESGNPETAAIFAAMRDAARDWDGSDPIRPLVP